MVTVEDAREGPLEEIHEIKRNFDGDVDRGLELTGVGEKMEQQETSYSCTGQSNLT
jgi:hypothetical protein